MNLDKANELTFYISRVLIPLPYDTEKAISLLYSELPKEISVITLNNQKGDTIIEIKQITYRIQSSINLQNISQILKLTLFPRIDNQLTEFEYYEISPLMQNFSTFPLYSPIIVNPLSEFKYILKIELATRQIPNETIDFTLFVRLAGIVRQK
ncbi:MAG: hypothetical protein ABIM49_03840 [candidate division WOR-3 bacterium]